MRAEYDNTSLFSILLQAVLALCVLTAATGCGSSFDTDAKRVLVIGMDGLDHRLVEQMMNEGKLPNFAKLRDMGGFRPLTTSIPPESPVAWSNFISGMNPGGHGVKDFFLMDPAIQEGSGLRDSVTKIEGEARELNLFGYKLPLGGVSVTNGRVGKAFWQVLEEERVPATVNRMPANYPLVETEQRTLSGMGTPEIGGAVQHYTLLTDDLPANRYEIKSGDVREVFPSQGRVKTMLTGPPQSKEGNPPSETELLVYYDEESQAAKIVVGEETAVVKVGEWSRWVPVSFEVMPLMSVGGICRFLLQEIGPSFRLFVSSVHNDPRAPASPISTPADYASELYDDLGYFHTKGLPMEYSAFRDEVLRAGDWVKQMEFMRQEEFKILTHELDRFDSGLLFCYFSHTDLPIHCLWNMVDETSPSHDKELAARYGDTIEDIYRGADESLGDVLGWLENNEDVLLLILSDHGMGPYNRAINLNTWLVQEGYLVLKDGIEPGEIKPGAPVTLTNPDHVDWTKTRAYGFGFAGVFVNLIGREKHGIVAPEDRSALMAEISQKLQAWKDPESDQPMFKRVYRAEDVYDGPEAYEKEGPDLIVGTYRGWRVSDDSAQGEVPVEPVVDNMSAWSGDHSMAHDEVPGILFSNRPIAAETPALYDVTATILAEYGIDKLPEMIGTSVF